jgi:hypothetical protein
MEEEVLVDTTPAKKVVVSSLTRDARPDECLFDLIDNSIDAARQDMCKTGKMTLDEHGLPANYDCYWIQLDLSTKAIKVADNCGGIDLNHFCEVMLRFGQQSEHPFGIGAFGVGLNRALFRLGTSSCVITDNGRSVNSVEINHEQYLASGEWAIPASTRTSSASENCGTTIEILDPPGALARDLARPEWLEKLKTAAARRYFRLLEKGVEIFVNGESLRPIYPHLREDGQYEIERVRYTEIDGVSVYLVAGEHAKHRFRSEDDFDYKVARSLTPEFGWTVVCNDRAILVADRSPRTGWEATWHNEYNGFVGYVWFVSKNSEQLPWNTKKSDVDVNNEVYQVALEGMRRLATNWRGYNRRKKPQSTPTDGDSKPNSPKAGMAASSDKAKSQRTEKPKPRPDPRLDHTKSLAVIPKDIDESHCQDKMLKLVREAKTLRLDDYTYTGLLALRTLFELSAIQYLALTNRLEPFKRECLAAINEARDGKGKGRLSMKEEHNFNPSFDDICSYFINHPDAWGLKDFSYLKHSLDAMNMHRKVLNGVAHNPWRTLSVSQAIEIRDTTVPLLRHLLSAIPAQKVD